MNEGKRRSYTIDAMLVGEARPFRGDEKSAIVKRPVNNPVAIGALGLAGDEQADRVNHGGPEMAVHVYPQDHHAFWRQELGDHPLLGEPGAFGSNLAVSGLLETDLNIGDRYRLGTALLEVSQPRKPCWKIEHRFGHKGMVATILRTGRSGWYFRVIEEGVAQAGDELSLLQRGSKDWTVAKVFAQLWGVGEKADGNDPAAMAALAGLSTLSHELRVAADRKS